MKASIYLILCILFLSACQKDEISQGVNTDNLAHNYMGDLLLLVVSDTLEAAYTYSINSAELYTDSLPIFYTTSTVNPYQDKDVHLHFASTTDTLYTRSHLDTLSFNANPLDLKQISTSYHYMRIPFLLKDFTIEYPNHKIQIEKSWNKISNLFVVRSYRSAAMSKVFGHRMVVTEFDPELGFSTPKAKYIFILSKW